MDILPRPKRCNEQAFSKQCPIVSCILFFFFVKKCLHLVFYFVCSIFTEVVLCWSKSLLFYVEKSTTSSLFTVFIRKLTLVLLRTIQKQLSGQP